VGLLLTLLILLRQHPGGDEGRRFAALADTLAATVGTALWFVLVAGLLVGSSTSASLGPWPAAAVLLLVGVSYRLSLGFRAP